MWRFASRGVDELAARPAAHAFTGLDLLTFNRGGVDAVERGGDYQGGVSDVAG
mgnify:CR=1